MSGGYFPLFRKFLDSSIMDLEVETRFVFLTLLLKADKQGVVHATRSALARSAAMDLESVEAALAILQEPDPDSTTLDDDGRRVAEIEPNTWLVLNYERYAEMAHSDRRRQQLAEASRKYRRRHQASSQDDDASSKNNDASSDSHQSPSGSGLVLGSGKKKGGAGGKKKFKVPTAKEVQEYLNEKEEWRFTGQEFVDANEQKGWLVGRTRTPMKDWRAAVRTWIAFRDKDGAGGKIENYFQRELEQAAKEEEEFKKKVQRGEA